METKNESLVPVYKQAFAGALFYPNTQEGLKTLFAEQEHKIDKIFITSPNHDHFWHMNTVIEKCSDKKIFMEKPLFRTVEEFEGFDFERAKESSITIGLTLRYSSMARICAQQLQAHQKELGTLRNVKAWENLNFPHALTAFIMGWRRYVDLSGGFLLEKSIHDLDLALFFLDELGVKPTDITISTKTDNKFFIKQRKKELLKHIMGNEAFQTKAAQSKNNPWEPFNFVRDDKGTIDWKKSLDEIFAEYPDDKDFTNQNIIPDYHILLARLQGRDTSPVDLKLKVDACGFRPKTERGQRFIFDKGQVLIDIMGSKMDVTYNDGRSHSYELHTNNSDHADGDEYIIRTILNEKLPGGYHMATLQDPIVLLGNQMALVSEKQAKQADTKPTCLQKVGEKWIVKSEN